jgi:TRAP-type C4-dicarboxylate transport system permease large subunit
MWIKDSEGTKSVTLTVVVATLGVALGKLLLSGMVIKGIEMGTFTGTDFAAVVTPVFALYWGRRNLNMNKEDKE